MHRAELLSVVINRLQFKVDEIWNELILSSSRHKKHLCLWPPLCLLRAHSPCCYTVCINVCRSTEKTERPWGFHHRFVRLADSICFVCCRFPRLIRVGTMRFIHNTMIHNEQTFVFSLPACCRWARFCWPEASARSHRRWRRFILELSRCSASDVDLVTVGFFVGDLRFVLFWFYLRLLAYVEVNVFISVHHQQRG